MDIGTQKSLKYWYRPNVSIINIMISETKELFRCASARIPQHRKQLMMSVFNDIAYLIRYHKNQIVSKLIRSHSRLVRTVLVAPIVACVIHSRPHVLTTLTGSISDLIGWKTHDRFESVIYVSCVVDVCDCMRTVWGKKQSQVNFLPCLVLKDGGSGAESCGTVRNVLFLLLSTSCCKGTTLCWTEMEGDVLSGLQTLQHTLFVTSELGLSFSKYVSCLYCNLLTGLLILQAHQTLRNLYSDINIGPDILQFDSFICLFAWPVLCFLLIFFTSDDTLQNMKITIHSK